MGEKMKNFKKEVYIGRLKDDHRYHVFVKIEYNNKRLSITGEETTKNKKYFRSSGQITLDPNEIEFAPGWNKEKVERLENIWNKWHLNDMRTGCEHQRKNWNFDKEIEIVDFTWSKKFNDMRKRAEDGLMSEQEYNEYKQLVPNVFEATVNTTRHRWMSPIICGLLYKKLIRITGTRTNQVRWVHQDEHPDGLLCKPCEICGYKYGTKWIHEDVPEEILQELMEM
jgi:hypothetical protein